MVFQGAMNAFDPVKRIGDQIAEPMELHGSRRAREAAARVRELLETVGISPTRARSYPHELSGGMRQRAAIAMALACSPRVLLADEPTTALDVMVQAQVLELLTYLSNELGLALVFVTHDLPIVAQTCTHAAVMYAGQDRRAGADRGSLPRDAASLHADAVGGDAGSRRRTRTCSRSPACRRGSTRSSTDVRSRRAATSPRHAARRSGPSCGRSATSTSSACHFASSVEVVSVTEPRHERSSAPRGRRPRRPLPRRPRAQRRDPAPAAPVRARGLRRLAQGRDGARWSRSSVSRAAARRRPRRRSSGSSATDSGSVRFDGIDVTSLAQDDLRALRRRMQIIYQDPYESFDPRFRVSTTVAEPLVIHRIGSRAERRVAVDQCARAGRARAAGALRGAVPARALRRPEAAGRARREPGAGTRSPHRRRARLDARRLRPRRASSRSSTSCATAASRSS